MLFGICSASSSSVFSINRTWVLLSGTLSVISFKKCTSIIIIFVVNVGSFTFFIMV